MKIAAALASLTLIATPLVFAAPATAATTPSKEACSSDGTSTPYACMEVNSRKVPSGDPVTFTGKLSPSAFKNLKAWTKGDNIVCLTRYKPRPEADGTWPWTTMEGACTTVRNNGSFTINAELGRKGLFYYGVEMGPCRGSADLCENGDRGLLGVNDGDDDRVVALRTT